VPKSGHVTITKIENLRIDTQKFSDSKSAIIFDLRQKNNEIIAEKPFPNSGVTRRCADAWPS